MSALVSAERSTGSAERGEELAARERATEAGRRAGASSLFLFSAAFAGERR